MHAHWAEIRITAPGGVEGEQFEHAVWNLVAEFEQSGRVLAPVSGIARDGRDMLVFVLTPDADALSARHDPDPTRRRSARAQLEQLGASIETRVRGADVDGIRLCACPAHRELVLATDATETGPPLRCGECVGVVPLFRVDPERMFDAYDLYDWASVYRACDRLDLDSGFGASFGSGQTADASSPLMQRGRELASILESITGVRVFVDILVRECDSHEQDRKRRCPGCGEDWRVRDLDNHFYLFRCDLCRWVSAPAFGERTR